MPWENIRRRRILRQMLKNNLLELISWLPHLLRHHLACPSHMLHVGGHGRWVPARQVPGYFDSIPRRQAETKASYRSRRARWYKNDLGAGEKSFLKKRRTPRQADEPVNGRV